MIYISNLQKAMGSNMRTSWIKVLLLSFIGGTFLPACSTVNTIVPENMQFWDGISSFSEDSPNLNNTPSDEAIRQAREEATELRKQLESDRDRARRLAMGLPLPDDMPQQQAPQKYNQDYTILTQTQRSMWIRHDNLMSGTMTPEIANPVVEQDLPPEMFVPSNVVINYDIVPDAQYQPPLYAEQAKDYVQTGNIVTNPSEESDLIDYQPIDTQATVTDSKKKSDFIPSLAYGDPAGLIFFGYGSAALSDADIAFLHDLANEMKETTGPVRVVGHASPDVKAENPAQGRAKNLMMSDKRAAAVMKKLVGFGVNKDRIEVSAYGDSIPLFAIEGKTPDEADRRVEIYY